MVRILAAEVCVTPQGQPEVELGMLPLNVDLPGPPPAARGTGMVSVRLTLHTSRGDLTIRQPLSLQAEETLDMLDLSGRPTPGLVGHFRPDYEPPQAQAAGRAVGRAQYEAMLRSVEGHRSSTSSGWTWKWPFVWPFARSRSSERPDRRPKPPERSPEPPTDPGVSGFHARLPRAPLVPSDQTAAVPSDQATVPGAQTVAMPTPPAVDPNAEYYARLLVYPDANLEVIEAAYRQLMMKYHPDLARGDPERLAELERRAAALNEAFGAVRRRKSTRATDPLHSIEP